MSLSASSAVLLPSAATLRVLRKRARRQPLAVAGQALLTFVVNEGPRPEIVRLD